jgi:hypothetical protein
VTVENPYHVDPQEDLTHKVPGDVALWSENYFFQCYDPAAQVGIWTHLGRTPHDPAIWRALVTVYLPGGALLVSKTYGRGPQDDGVAGPHNGTLAFRCDEPLTTWTVRAETMARPTTRVELAGGLLDGGLLADGAVVPVAFEYRFDALTPMWDLGAADMSGQSWALTHYEQAGKVSGRLQCGETAYELSGTGMRDHSHGPRNFAHFRRGSWVHAEFPSGRVFAALRMWTNDGEVALNRAFISEDGKLREATPVDLPTLEGPRGDPGQVLVRLDDGGTLAEIDVEVLHAKTMTLAEPNEILYGVDATDPRIKIINEAVVRCRWDGEEGWGLCERSRRIEDLTL